MRLAHSLSIALHSAFISPHAAWNLCSPSSSDPPMSANPGKWTLRSGAAARGDCLCRPPFGHPAWPRGILSSRPSRNCPTLARRCPHVGRGRRPPEHQLSPTQPAVRGSETGQMAPPPHAMVSSKHKVARAPRNKQLSTSHHFLAIIFTTPPHAPNHSNF